MEDNTDDGVHLKVLKLYTYIQINTGIVKIISKMRKQKLKFKHEFLVFLDKCKHKILYCRQTIVMESKRI